MKNSILWSMLAFTLLMTNTSCNKYEEELHHLNDLQETLQANKDNFDLDIPLFDTRIEFIEKTLRTFANDYTDTMSLELGNKLSRYKAIKKIYSKSVKEYNRNELEQSELEKQLANLKTDLKNGKFSKDEFKGYYNTEKTDVQALVASTNSVKKTLYEVEPDYKRITEELLPILEEIEK